MKKVLITGANSYIGTSFEDYVHQHYADQLDIHTIDMIDGSWREKHFTLDGRALEDGGQPYDVIFHVAGLAHTDVGNVDEETKRRYYAINTDLAIETAQKAKDDGVGQFVFMSSMIVYGKATHIDKTTKPHPANFYGDSKWKADKGVRRLATAPGEDGEIGKGGFVVTVLRPPMIYGKGSKGNYPMLSKIGRRVPVFPDYKNKRSMLYIENLCEFLAQVMIREVGGVFWPQNGEYSSTSDIVRSIAAVHKHRVVVSRLLNPAVAIAKRCPVKKIRDLSNKAFGDSWYEMSMSRYDFKYQLYALKDSILRTEA